jgi:tRNA (guanine26-N2/guanine27-N2)-dimethyltransferase
MNIALPLAGSGIRGIRFLRELNKDKIRQIYFNDHKENFIRTIKNNLRLNNLEAGCDKIRIFNQDANLFLLNQEGFDYIDLDPFGSPNPFLAAAINKISRQGILAITATDTAALTGTYPKVTKRKYWATSLKSHLMHETGLRILIRKVQLQGTQFDKALVPVLAYYKDHYFRVYFRSEKGKEKCDQLIRQHQYLLFNPKTLEFKTSLYNKEEGFCFIGPFWTGRLFDRKLIAKMAKNNFFPEEQKFLDRLKEESKIDVVGFVDIHRLAKAYRIEAPKIESVLKKLKAVRTHFSSTGIKTQKGIEEVIREIKA